jgi:hypothetical protein
MPTQTDNFNLILFVTLLLFLEFDNLALFQSFYHCFNSQTNHAGLALKRNSIGPNDQLNNRSNSDP